jgi:hypothetical protein
VKYKLINKLVKFFIIIFILILIYSFYRDQIVFDGIYSSIYLLYYIFSIIGIIFWTVLLRQSVEYQANILLFTFSLIVCLFLVEGTLTFIDYKNHSSQNNNFKKNIVTDSIDDKKSKFKVIKGLEFDGIKASTSIGSNSYPNGLINEEKESILPLGGISNVFTIYCNENGYFMKYKSDRFGFNNPDYVWDNNTEWLLIGDSFAQGACVHPKEGIAAVMQSLTENLALTLGIGGNGPLAELGSLKEYGKLTMPKRVLWMYYEGNDLLSDIHRERKSPLLMNYLEDNFSQNLTSRQEEIDRRLEKFISDSLRINNKNLTPKKISFSILKFIKLTLARDLINIDKTKSNSDIYPIFSEILNNAKKYVKSWGGEFYFVYLPSFERYSDTFNPDKYKKDELIQAVKKLGIDVIDVDNLVFQKAKDPLSLFPYRDQVQSHYNKEGYFLVSKTIISNTSN